MAARARRRLDFSGAAALDFSEMESLILAQNERWRHGLGMQVERDPSGSSGGRVSNT